MGSKQKPKGEGKKANQEKTREKPRRSLPAGTYPTGLREEKEKNKIYNTKSGILYPTRMTAFPAHKGHQEHQVTKLTYHELKPASGKYAISVSTCIGKTHLPLYPCGSALRTLLQASGRPSCCLVWCCPSGLVLLGRGGPVETKQIEL